MGKIKLIEFLPPILFRGIIYLKKKFSASNKTIKYSPFDQLPNDFNAKWILDVGANVGDVAVAALKSFPGSQVICFEPVSKTYETLVNNMKDFSKRSYFYNLALSDKNGDGLINITNYHGANSIPAQTSIHKEINSYISELGTEKISLVKLDDFFNNFPNERIDIMKIDVEGHELNVLNGGLSFIANNVDIVIIEISLMRDKSVNKQSLFDIFAFFNKIDFYFINAIDLNYVEDKPIQLTQMDCIFRNKKYISSP
jgi:FkbM family methyltransferase